MKPGKHPRRQVFSNPRAQIRIVLVFGALAVLFAATNCFVAAGSLRGIASEVERLPPTAAAKRDIAILLEKHSETLNLQLSVWVLLTFFVILMGGVVLSHHIGGPIYQLRSYLRGLAENSIPPRPIHFRQYDFFHDLAETFNDFQRSRGILSPDNGAPAPGPKDNKSVDAVPPQQPR